MDADSRRPLSYMITRAFKKTQLREKLSTDDGMAAFMDALCGPNGWCYDASEDVWGD
jgi:hypothetical protein